METFLLGGCASKTTETTASKSEKITVKNLLGRKITLKSLEVIGKIIGNENRSKEVVDYMKNCKNDLDKRTKDISENEKPNTYVGAVNMKGSHGIESTQGNYALLKAVHGKNVVDETGKIGSVMIDKEKLLKWNPDKIFIDEGGLQVVQEDYKKNPSYYNNLSAVKNGELYSQMPYNFYTTSFEYFIKIDI